MFKNTTHKIASLAKQNKISSALLAFSGVALWVIFSSYVAGPAKSGNQLVTGAPFNSGLTCAQSGCHGGGAFGGTITTQLLDSATILPVTAYVTGKAYKFQILLKKTTGKPKYGFQTTAATATGTNVNKWGKATAGTHSILKVKHNYVEQSTALTSGTITIPWTGAAAGTGSVVFYTAGNLVNGDGGTSGDQVVNNSLTITQAPAPVAPWCRLGSRGWLPASGH